MGLSYEAVRRLRQDGLEPDAEGRWPLEEARRLKAARQERGQGIGGWTDAALTMKERKLAAEAQFKEMIVLREMGKLISKADVQRLWRTRVITVKNRLKAMGRELAPRVAHKGPQEAQAIIDERVFEVLRLLAHTDYLPDVDSADRTPS